MGDLLLSIDDDDIMVLRINRLRWCQEDAKRLGYTALSLAYSRALVRQMDALSALYRAKAENIRTKRNG